MNFRDDVLVLPTYSLTTCSLDKSSGRDVGPAVFPASPLSCGLVLSATKPARMLSRRQSHRLSTLDCDCTLREKFPHHIPGDIGQPEIPARVPERQPLMIEAEQLQNRRVK